MACKQLTRDSERMLGTSNDSSSIEIHFPSIEHEEAVQYRLMEVNDPRIMGSIEAGKKLFIRGGMDDDAVICTAEETFSLRELVTSNMFLVVEKEESRGLVVGKPTTTLEVTFMPRAPGIDKLDKALRAHPYNGSNAEEAAFTGVDELHVEKIYGSIPASSNEISDFLKTQGALVIRDHYRIIGSNLLCRFFDLFLNTFVLEDWSLSEPVEFERKWPALKQYEDEFPIELAQHIISCHVAQSGLLDFDKIARFLAQELLKARSQWDLEDFIESWERALVDLIHPTLPLIADFVLQERHPGSGRLEIRQFFRSNLPSDPENRFIALFKTKSRWQYDELIPFIADLGKDSKELDAIILKHGRFSTQKDVRYITPRSQLLE